MKGHGMCGDVTLKVTPQKRELHACHCEMCRRWTGSVFVEFDVAEGDLGCEGPVRTIASSGWAERAWCDTCGSTLWYRVTVPGHEHYSVAAGLFDDAGGFVLTKEVYIDRKPDGFAFAGHTMTMTEAEVEAAFAPLRDAQEGVA